MLDAKSAINVAAIPQASRVYKDIKGAYYGGICEIYYPHVAEGGYYDVNSL